jgi:hypothetical protein
MIEALTKDQNDCPKGKEQRVEELLESKIFIDPFHTEYSDPPFIKHGAFNPADILGCDASSWVDVLTNLSPRLPVQLHCEPFNIGDGPKPDSQPIFRKTVNLLKGIPEVADLLKTNLPSGEPSRARIKMRLATAGKFIHRNRFKRRQIIMCLSGQSTWLFLSSYGGASDVYLNRAANKNWCGFRSGSFSSMLSVEQMEKIVADLPEGVVGKVVTFKAGDLMEFDGRWWHATSYSDPVLSLFFTPGEDMEAAVKQHKERHSQPKHSVFQICKISMAKTAKLSNTWQKDEKGNNISYGQDEGFYTLNKKACEHDDDC